MAATTVLPRPKQYDDTFWKPISLWLTTTDHKLIGIMYMVTGVLSFVIGGIFALVVRLQLATPNAKIVDPETYNQLISAHGVTMIFFFVTIFLTGIANYMVPIMIGARDMAFPRVNLLGFWLVPVSIILYYSGFFTGGAPGMKLTRLPLFVWAQISTSILLLVVGAPLAAAMILVEFDRQLGTQFFTTQGRPVLYQHLFWFFGHPEVYIMILPGFGMISEIIPVFARKPIFGYMSMVAALFGIVFLSMTVWAHHMFTVGMNTYVEGFFMLMTMLIAVPTGIKFFNWIATAWWGSIEFTVPMKFVFGFLATFLIGGITGVYLASVPVDTQLHQSYYVVAHLHYVLFGGSVFTIFAGIYYWFPKITGRMLNRTLGEWNFWTLFIGFNGTFLIMHTLGLEG
ncbi:MAG: cytochrome ubiquinol oxidase subunit I, partial [Chloroflexi bacterium 13_1_20CM_4_66_7]